MPARKLPTAVAHADWGISTTKRWLCVAYLHEEREVYEVMAPRLVGDASSLLGRLAAEAGGSVLVGFDFPIGIPIAYADAAGVTSFTAFLPELGRGIWKDFYAVAELPSEISLHRPYYPQRPGGTSQAHLNQALGVSTISELLRRCERKTEDRNAACCLFWTLGGNQVGKAALSGWREVLEPALQDPKLDVSLWPFDGDLADLVANHQVVVAETYPAEFYRHLGIVLDGGKRDQTTRRSQANVFRSWREEPEIHDHVMYSESAAQEFVAGFGSARDGEDRFDAFVGLLGMLNVLFGRRSAGAPPDPRQRALEGWILGAAELNPRSAA